MLLLFVAAVAYPQNQAVDSVLQVVQKHTGDSLEVKSLIWLGKFTSKKDFHASFRYFREALRLAEHLQDSKKSTAIYNELGNLYHTLGKYDSSLFFHRNALAHALANSNVHQSSYACEGIALTFLRLIDRKSVV